MRGRGGQIGAWKHPTRSDNVGMNIIALFVLGLAAVLALTVIVFRRNPKVTARRELILDWVRFLFITGFILVYMFHFAMVQPVGHG